jgi:hypothetical protein
VGEIGILHRRNHLGGQINRPDRPGCALGDDGKVYDDVTFKPM